MSPFKTVYRWDAPPLLKWVEESSRIEEVNTMIRDKNLILDELKSNLNRVQEKMKLVVDKHRPEVEFEVGDRVFLKLQPYHFRLLASCPNEKLSPRFYGTYIVLERIGKVAYQSQLPEGSKIHLVFHVSQLKKQVGPVVMDQPLLSCLNEDLELELQPVEILDCRYSAQSNLEQPVK